MVGDPETFSGPVILLTTTHRGYGASTAAYYLAQALANQGHVVGIADLSLRASPLKRLLARDTPERIYSVSVLSGSAPDLPILMEHVRAGARPGTTVVLIDLNNRLFRLTEDAPLPFAFGVIGAVASAEGRKESQRLVKQLHYAAGYQPRLGVVFLRADPEQEASREQVNNGLPVLETIPADYMLASAGGSGPPVLPSDPYLFSSRRLAQTLVNLIPLRRP